MEPKINAFAFTYYDEALAKARKAEAKFAKTDGRIRALEGIRLNWFLSIIRALKKLEKRGQLAYHGDLKPENIIIKPSGSVVMIDPALRDTERGLISTTPHYNPLILQSQKADVMGIGVMLYEILTGTLPFDEVPWPYAGREQGSE